MKIAQPDSVVTSVSAQVTSFLSAPKCLIDGKSHAGLSGKTYSVFNPPDGSVLAEVPACGAEDVNRAVKAARRAFEGPWSQMLKAQRQAFS